MCQTLRTRRNDKIHDYDTDPEAEAPGVHNFREARDRIHPDMDLGDRDLRVRVLRRRTIWTKQQQST